MYDRLMTVLSEIRETFYNASWGVCEEKTIENIILLTHVSPRKYCFSGYNKSIYFPFYKEGIEIVVDNVSKEHWANYF